MFSSNKENKNDNFIGEHYIKVSPKTANGYHCTSCKNCVISGYGNYTCQFSKPILIINNEKATKEYFWCNGKNYNSKY